MFCKILSFFILITISTLSIAANTLEFISLQHRDSQSMIPLLKPFVGPEGTVSGQDYQLIIRTSPDNLATLKSIIEKFDQPQQQLLITVTQDSALVSQERKTAISTTIYNDHHNPRHVHPQIHNRIKLKRTQQRANDNLGQSLTVLDGHEAWIQVGQEIAVPTTTVNNNNGDVVGNGIYFKPATSGFYVLPRLQGNMVELDISPNKSQPGIGFGNIKTHSAHSKIRVRLGEWTSLGGDLRERNRRQYGLGIHQTKRTRDENTIYIKVERSQ